jgi:hypothetical protein
VRNTTRSRQGSKEKRNIPQRPQVNLSNVSEHAVTATANAHNRAKGIKVAATGDKFNTYKTRIT